MRGPLHIAFFKQYGTDAKVGERGALQLKHCQRHSRPVSLASFNKVTAQTKLSESFGQEVANYN